jgi:hypothetical protein
MSSSETSYGRPKGWHLYQLAEGEPCALRATSGPEVQLFGELGHLTDKQMRALRTLLKLMSRAVRTFRIRLSEQR